MAEHLNSLGSSPEAPSSKPKEGVNNAEALSSNLEGKFEAAIETHQEAAPERASSKAASQPHGGSTGVATATSAHAGQDTTITTVPTTEKELRIALRTKILDTVKRIDTEIAAIKKEKQGAYALTEAIKRKRRLMNLLKDMAHYAMSKLKSLYRDFFPNSQ